jgi:hypothetical protein
MTQYNLDETTIAYLVGLLEKEKKNLNDEYLKECSDIENIKNMLTAKSIPTQENEPDKVESTKKHDIGEVVGKIGRIRIGKKVLIDIREQNIEKDRKAISRLLKEKYGFTKKTSITYSNIYTRWLQSKNPLERIRDWGVKKHTEIEHGRKTLGACIGKYRSQSIYENPAWEILRLPEGYKNPDVVNILKEYSRYTNLKPDTLRNLAYGYLYWMHQNGDIVTIKDTDIRTIRGKRARKYKSVWKEGMTDSRGTNT